MKAADLKSLSVDDLLTLRDHVNATLASRVDTERRDLEMRLKRLKGFRSSEAAPVRTGKRGRPRKEKKVRKVAPKFRNPENDEEVWTGRGRRPLWIARAEKNGKTLEDFRI